MQHDGSATATAMGCRGSAMPVPWQFHGKALEMPLAVPWQSHGCHGSAMALPGKCHSSAAALPCSATEVHCAPPHTTLSGVLRWKALMIHHAYKKLSGVHQQEGLRHGASRLQVAVHKSSRFMDHGSRTLEPGLRIQQQDRR